MDFGHIFGCAYFVVHQHTPCVSPGGVDVHRVQHSHNLHGDAFILQRSHDALPQPVARRSQRDPVKQQLR